MDLLKCLTPAFEELYAAVFQPAIIPEIDEILIIDPFPLFAMCGNAYLQIKTANL